MQLVIEVKDGSTAKDIAHKLRWQANLIEGMDPKEAAAVKNTEAKPATKKAAAPSADEDDDFKADDSGEPNGFDEDDAPVAEASFDDAGDDDAEPEAKEPAKKAKAHGKSGAATKVKKVTLDEVNDSCKAYAQAKGRPATLAILQKKFKTKSVTALKPEQYQACIDAMAVN